MHNIWQVDQQVHQFGIVLNFDYIKHCCMKIVAVAARSLESAQKFAERHKIDKAYGSYENVATDPDVGMLRWYCKDLLMFVHK